MGIPKIEVKKVEIQTIRIIGDYPNDSREISGQIQINFMQKSKLAYFKVFKVHKKI